jgi:hypothetical protein
MQPRLATPTRPARSAAQRRSLRDGVPQRALIISGGKRKPAKPDPARALGQDDDASAQPARSRCSADATVPVSKLIRACLG